MMLIDHGDSGRHRRLSGISLSFFVLVRVIHFGVILALKMKVSLRLTARPSGRWRPRFPCPAAGLEKYKDWNKSPEFSGLAVESEQKEWKKITSDEEAERFIQLFWAKRDPDLKTPVNEFKIAFDQRVKEADQLFALPRTRGSLTERGKLYVLVGPPKDLKRQVGIKPQPIAPPGQVPPPNDPGTSIGESLATFIYEAAQLPEWAGSEILPGGVRRRVGFGLHRRERRRRSEAPRDEGPPGVDPEPVAEGGSALQDGRRARERIARRPRRPPPRP